MIYIFFYFVVQQYIEPTWVVFMLSRMVQITCSTFMVQTTLAIDLLIANISEKLHVSRISIPPSILF